MCVKKKNQKEVSLLRFLWYNKRMQNFSGYADCEKPVSNALWCPVMKE